MNLRSLLLVLLWALALLDLWSAWELLNLADLASQEFAGEWSQAEANALYLRRAVVGATQLTVFVAAVTAFLTWVHRMYSRLPPTPGGGPRYSPTWAVGWFLVPGYNLFRPFGIVQELRDYGVQGVPEGRARIGRAQVGLWWALVLAVSLTGLYTGWALLNAVESTELVLASRMRAAHDLGQAAAAWATVSLVRRIQPA